MATFKEKLFAAAKKQKTLSSLEHFLETFDAVEIDYEDVQWQLNLLEEAVNQNAADLLVCCLAAGSGFDLTDVDKRTWLHKAIINNDVAIETITFILQQTRDINCQDRWGRTPLIEAICSKRPCNVKLPLVKLIIRKDADVNLGDNFLTTPMQCLFQNYFSFSKYTIPPTILELFHLLLDAGANASCHDWFGKSCLHAAIVQFPAFDDYAQENSCSNIVIDVVNHLLKEGTDANDGDNAGRSSVHFAAISRSIEILNMLAQNGADFNRKNNMLMGPLYDFCGQTVSEDEADVDEIVRVIDCLIHNGCSINSQANDKSTALHIAAVKHNAHMCQCLLNHGAEVHIGDHLDRTPLHLASRNTAGSRISTVLINHGCSVNRKDVYKYTALHYAAMMENSEMVMLLIERGACPNVPGQLGITPFHLAGERGSADTIKCFIQAGGNPNSKDFWGATPLHFAACDGNHDAIEELLVSAPESNTLDKSGRSSLWHAQHMGHKKAACTLAGSETGISFGNLSIFPNRPLVKPDEQSLDEYYKSVRDALQSIGNGQDIAKEILGTPGLGQVSFLNESGDILEAINHLLEVVMNRVGQIDPRFKGAIISSGSCQEGLKCGYPDEFDFMFSLTDFGNLIEGLEPAERIHGFVKPRVNPAQEEFREFITESGHLNAHTLLRYFNKLCIQATFEVGGNTSKHIYRGWTLSIDSESFYNKTVLPLGNLPTHSLTWRGALYKGLDVTFDITPAVFVPSWPSGNIQRSLLLPNIDQNGVFVVPKFSDRQFIASDTGDFYRDRFITQPHGTMEMASIWRLSFSHIECKIMSVLPDAIKNGCRLAKAFRQEPLSCSLYLIREPSAVSARQKPAHNLIVSDGIQIVIDSDTEDELSVKSEDESESNSTGESEETDEGEVEFSAGDAIPSYFLKSIFMHEVERLLQENHGQWPSHDVSLQLSVNVYKRLLEAIQQGKWVSSYFVPEQHILYNRISTEDGYFNITEQYTKRIIRMMVDLGFENDWKIKVNYVIPI